MLVRASAKVPSLLLMDEPTAQLDPSVVVGVRVLCVDRRAGGGADTNSGWFRQ